MRPWKFFGLAMNFDFEDLVRSKAIASQDASFLVSLCLVPTRNLKRPFSVTVPAICLVKGCLLLCRDRRYFCLLQFMDAGSSLADYSP